jgi:phage terminase large subunit GpA-like protein
VTHAPARPIFSPAERIVAWDWIGEALAASIHSEITHLSVSEWAEKKRIIPEGLSSMPGPFSWSVTPYLREIADCLSAASPVQEIVVKKGAQIGFTVGVLENWIGYAIDAEPGPMMFVSGDKEMAEAAIELRIDRMIQSAGIAGKIFSQSENKDNKKSGNTKKQKEFPGGFLLAAGPNSAAKLRQFSVRYLALDEIDAYPASTEGEGDPLSLLRRRTDSFESIRKILYGSTPLIAQTSKIDRLYLEGDQRQYFVPCKHCGHMQPLKWAQIKYKTDESGGLDWSSVHYECEQCGGRWKNTDKAFFLPRGEWVPTAKPARPGIRSYQIPSLLSPIGMRSWESAADEFISTKDDPAKLRVFINTFLGESWVERGEAPRYERIMLRREDYAPEAIDAEGNLVDAILPDATLILTMGADVQKDRIECEVVAWGAGRESWSAGYHVIHGETADLQDPCWTQLSNLILSQHAGRPIVMTLVDSGYNAPTVYAFCERFESGVYPVKGDSRASASPRRYMLKDVPGYLCKRIDLYTDDLKLEIYGYLAKGLPESPDLPAPHGYCHFPEDYSEAYFRQLTAESRVPERTRTGQVRYVWHKPEGRRNEALDCRVYSTAALYVFATALCESEDGSIDWPAFWEWAVQFARDCKK